MAAISESGQGPIPAGNDRILSMQMRMLIGFLGASFSVSTAIVPAVHRYVKLSASAEAEARNQLELLFPLGAELVPWLFVWLLTIVIVAAQQERNALVLSIFAIGLPATFAGLIDFTAYFGTQ